MLKIKDDVDLKELEKFGFKHDSIFGVEMYIKSKPHKKEANDHIIDRVFVYEDNRRIVTDIYSSNTHRLQTDILSDLIQAGLIEQVEEECGNCIYCKYTDECDDSEI